jgi:glycosyltransferase involved in cell wall biosynthesis
MMYTAASAAYDTTHHKYDRIATNSSWTLKQMSLYHDVDESICSVIHPTASISTDIDGGQGDRYISMSRIDRGKRIDDIVNVMNELQLPTTVAGTGPDLSRVKAMGDQHIEFPGWVSGQAKRDLLRSAKAMLITCRRESFGISALEALMAGVPLIAIEGSAVDEMIVHGKNGYICDADRLDAMIRRFEADGVDWSPSQIQTHALDRYPPDAFGYNIRKWVHD